MKRENQKGFHSGLPPGLELGEGEDGREGADPGIIPEPPSPERLLNLDF